MADVIDLPITSSTAPFAVPTSDPGPPVNAFATFSATRQAMLQAYWAWLQSHPPAADVVHETAGTMALLQQLHALDHAGRETSGETP